MFQLKTTKKMTRYQQKEAESARSMVEILGVMALIGILTIGAYMGISLAFDKNHANQIIHDSKIAFTEAYATLPTSAKEWQTIPVQQQSKETLSLLFDLYDFYPDGEAPGTIYYTDCSYLVSGEDQVEQYKADCSYSVSDESGVEQYRSDCNYTVQQTASTSTNWVDGSGQSLTLYPSQSGGTFVTLGTGCPQNQYCGLRWQDSNNDGTWGAGETQTAPDNATGILWGKCQVLNTFESEPITDYQPGQGKVVQMIGCPQDQYCGLRWLDDDNDGVWGAGETQTAPANATGILWGRCQVLNTFESEPITTYTPGYGRVTVVEGCPPDMYCGLHWTQEEWSAGTSTPIASSSATGMLYGRCQNLQTFISKPLSRNDSGNTRYGIQKGCPLKTYCYLNWISDTSCETASASATGTIFGVCSPMTERGNCPYERTSYAEETKNKENPPTP